MCGIVGILKFEASARQDPKSLLATIVRMRDTMAHRGPDGEGAWVSPGGLIALGHRRLAIVDLSPEAAQPMSDSTGTAWVTYNGEIYNHMSLRRELEAMGHRFRTDHSDTEVIVEGYVRWGIRGLVDRLDGMFAFGLWDERKRTLFLVRDRVGIKPLYFARHAGALLFASEIKGILAYQDFPRDVEPAALNHYLSFLVAPAPLTMFKGVFKLPSAHILEIDERGKMQATRYWDAVPGRGIDSSEVERLSDAGKEQFYVRGIRERLEKSVAKRMMSDVPFGVFLSGGIDSSANTALMSRLMNRPVDTFTVGFKDHPHLNELDYARRVAREFNTNHREILIDEKDMVGYLDDLVHHQDEPIADWVCVPLYFVSKLAKDSGVTVVQVGEGSDEQFCGYNSYLAYLRLHRSFWQPYMRLAPQGLRNGIAAAAGAAANAIYGLDRYADILRRAAAGQELFWSGAHAFWNIQKDRLRPNNMPTLENGWGEIKTAGLNVGGLASSDSAEVIREYFSAFDREHPGQDALARMIYSEFRLRLPELLLMRVDKITMSTAVEGRVPFLDYRLVEFSMDIPMAWKIRGGRSKYLLKKALNDLLPEEIIHRKKMGFAAPMAHWLRGAFGKQARSTVMGSALFDRGYFSRQHVADLFSDHLSGRRDNALHLWTLFNLAAWYDHWIDRRAAA